MSSPRVVLHPDNHEHDGLGVVFDSLLRAATENRIVLLCEGHPYEPDADAERRVACHGREWIGTNLNVNGLEAGGPDLPRLAWAMAARLSTGSGVPDHTELRDAPREGAAAVRALCILYAVIDESFEEALGDDEVRSFVAALRRRLGGSGALDEGSLWRGELHRGAHDVMRARQSKWPGGGLTFGGAATLCADRMRDALGMDASSSLQGEMDKILVTEREKKWAAVIGRCAESTQLPIHAVVGASHCGGLISTRAVRALGVDDADFRYHQARLPPPRLTELVACEVAADPFAPLGTGPP